MRIEKWDAEDTSYSDEYDRETVELCRELEARHQIYNNHELAVWLQDVPLYYLRGERYANKSKAIDSLRTALQEAHRKLEEAQPKFKVLCLVCRSRMNLVEKLPYGSGKEEQVLFYFQCGSCRELRHFFEDGTEHRSHPPSCDKCGAEFEKILTRKGNKITTALSCRDCGHSRDEVLDLDNLLDEPEPKIDEKFLEDRKRFCMTEEEGSEYIRQRELCKSPSAHRVGESR